MKDGDKKENTKKKESASLRFLYGSVPGRAILRALTGRWLSKAAGRYLDSRLSKHLVKGFIKKNGIDLSEYEKDSFSSFNDCFTRKIREGMRPFDGEPSVLCSPCDGLLSVYDISGDTVVPVKQSEYSVSRLLGGDAASKEFEGGVCVVIRLCVDNYHRYAYPDSGTKGENHFIPGKLHTVRPIALGKYPVFTENCREWTVLHTDNFGDVAMIEIGAMLVGKIKNHLGAGEFRRGDEKGMFLYGGSTVALLFERGKVTVDRRFYDATEKGEETPVRMGERIGSAP